MAMFSHRRLVAGFTLIEMLIGLVLVSFLFAISFRVFTYISSQMSRGSVDLQELQGARLALNYLRRDFRSAAPLIAKTATFVQKTKTARTPMVEAASYNRGPDSVPIVIADSEIHFFRQLYNTPDAETAPTTEQVNYRIDDTKKCLVRSSAGKERMFPDIKGAKFELYGHPLKPEIPLLLVTLTIDADVKDRGSARNVLELTTTISSPVAVQPLNYPRWHRNYF